MAAGHVGENAPYGPTLKPAAHLRKELSKLPREAVCSAVSSRVRGNCGEKFASRGCEDKIKHV